MDIFFTHYTSVLSIDRAIQVVLNRLQFRVARLVLWAELIRGRVCQQNGRTAIGRMAHLGRITVLEII